MAAPPIKIVRLDGIHSEPPVFSIPHTYVEYPTTPDVSTIPGRIGDADVVLTTRVPITASTLDACPNLKFVAVFAIGYDMVDLIACKERGIKVANVPAASSSTLDEAVAEHAISFYFALRRNLVGMHAKMVDGKEEWKSKGSLTSLKILSLLGVCFLKWGGLPRTCREETLCILGGGELVPGARVANLGRTLGMKVLIAERKGVPATSVRPGRIEFTIALQTSTVIILTMPLSPSTANTISQPEFRLIQPDGLVINVSRGGIVNEEALVDALRERKIAGASTDVYPEEPAGRE
ncbi:2-hydroxyacid dehydrogenase [Hyphodiscus hymeniophilus]|uniref:2-hydroxyacid dehydrogenase n=1 Tax=Hyphodiscus hymeniophilus TaxID=353542 RepID=A0A9P7AV95_9HELO|nr:2-hydroxyacid dehydrogenase [Hyphodiscus hymeniophilus]